MNNKILTAQPIQPLTLEGTAYQRGLGHGETFRHGFQTVLHIRYPDTDLEAFAVTSAGLIAFNGMNNRGVGICCNFLPLTSRQWLTIRHPPESYRGIPMTYLFAESRDR